MAHILRYFYFAPHHVFGLPGGFASLTPLPLVPVFPFPAYAFHMRPHSSVYMWYRNLNLLSIGYVFRPLLRPRLTQSRSALLLSLIHIFDNASGEIEVPVKMLVTRARTERPHGALLQFGTGIRYCMYSIGGRLRTRDASP